jgi:hypothetical protein
MAATAPLPTPAPPAGDEPRAAAALAVAPGPVAAPAADLEALQSEAELSLLRDTLIGIAVGAVVCAGLWALMVVVALAGTDWELGPAVWMGAAVGMFAGAFYGGWVGTMAGVRKLEHAEHETLPRA